jgi:phosphatidylinositol alpha-1,6-mannosyltransferase
MISDIVISQDFLPDIGGAHTWLYEVYKRWPSKVMIVAAAAECDREKQSKQAAFDREEHGNLVIRRGPIGIQDINLASIGFLKRAIRAYRYLARQALADRCRFHCLRAFPEGILALMCKCIGGGNHSIVCYAHGEEILVAGTSHQLSAMARWVYARSDAIIANSRNTKALVTGLCSAARVACVHPGVDRSFFLGGRTGARERIREHHGWSGDAFVLFSIARMEPRKNQATVIQAVASLRAMGYDVRYICAGGGETRGALESLTGDLMVKGSVVFPGQISDAEKREYFHAADAHILISVQHGAMIEGFGIVFIEAAAMGLPSIAGNSGGQTEAVLDGRTGLVVDGTSLEQVTLAIGRLADDHGLRRRLGVEAKAWAAQFEWDRVVLRTIASLNILGVEIA